MSDQAHTMAHLRSLPTCMAPGCTRPAAVQLVNGLNAPLGTYCASHGKAALRRFKSGGSP